MSFSTIKRKTDTTIFSEHVEKIAGKLAFEGECSKRSPIFTSLIWIWLTKYKVWRACVLWSPNSVHTLIPVCRGDAREIRCSYSWPHSSLAILKLTWLGGLSRSRRRDLHGEAWSLHFWSGWPVWQLRVGVRQQLNFCVRGCVRAALLIGKYLWKCFAFGPSSTVGSEYVDLFS